MKFPYCLLVFFLFACHSQKLDKSTLPKDFATLDSEQSLAYMNRNITLEKLTQLKDELLRIENLEVCEDTTKWDFIPVGMKSCGGPEFYIAYPVHRTNEVLDKVRNYNTAQHQYIKQHPDTSDCKEEPIPKSIECIDNRAVIQYEQN